MKTCSKYNCLNSSFHFNIFETDLSIFKDRIVFSTFLYFYVIEIFDLIAKYQANLNRLDLKRVVKFLLFEVSKSTNVCSAIK